MDRQPVSTENLVKERAKMLMEIQFVGFISEMTTATLQHLGRLKNAKTNQFHKNITQAERMISVLDMLEEKTKNNLTPMEKEHIRNSIDRLKRTYFEETQVRNESPASEEVISIRHILVDNESAAAEILSQVKSGEDFAEIAKLHSQCGYRADGGYIDNIKKGDFPQQVENVALKLEKDQISDIIQSIFGYHIIKLIDKKIEKQEA